MLGSLETLLAPTPPLVFSEVDAGAPGPAAPAIMEVEVDGVRGLRPMRCPSLLVGVARQLIGGLPSMVGSARRGAGAVFRTARMSSVDPELVPLFGSVSSQSTRTGGTTTDLDL